MSALPRSEALVPNLRTPEHALVAAVLHRAWIDLVAPPTMTSPDFAQHYAVCWVLSGEQDPFSFRWCCEILDLCDSAVNKIYNKAKEIQQNRRTEKWLT